MGGGVAECIAEGDQPVCCMAGRQGLVWRISELSKESAQISRSGRSSRGAYPDRWRV